MKKYLIRAAKSFVALCVLLVAIMALNRAMGSTLTIRETFYVMFHTTRGLLLPVVVVVLALCYPRFGFIVRRVEGDTELDREQIVNAFRSAGFSLRREEEGTLFFRADGFVQKLLLLWEDEIRVSQYGQWIELDGIRRGVARVQYRLDSYLQMKRRNEK